MAPILAQSGGAGGNQAWFALAWVGVLVAVVVVGALVVMALRRRLMRDPAGQSGDPFSLEELRRLKASGALSDEEFERARAVLIGRHAEARGSHEQHDRAGSGIHRSSPGRVRRNRG